MDKQKKQCTVEITQELQAYLCFLVTLLETVYEIGRRRGLKEATELDTDSVDDSSECDTD